MSLLEAATIRRASGEMKEYPIGGFPLKIYEKIINGRGFRFFPPKNDNMINVCSKKDMNIKYDNSKPNGQYRKDVDTSIFKNNIKDFTFKSLPEGIKEIYKLYESK